MAVLKNQRHERFAQLIASGKAASEAYGEVYDRVGRVAETSGSRLMRNVKVQERIVELQEKAADESVLTLREIQQFLAAVVRGAVGEVGPDSPLCQEYTKRFEAGGESSSDYEVVKIKVPCKLKAVELSAKLSGFLTEKREVTVESKASPVELESRLKTAMEFLAG